ncbi:DUF2330 domain-containing protein [Mycolicibacterium pallens]|uniref:DUF2330 domain-containing protein n=1 Tax=Mycolicibacterium pallens TaxID=370524 RepID=A0ABX8VQ91_9MYCO|nr:DUF2330 domain-containing protein [Mycolicibacterium pallens]QYL19233.1 DUF2330 domain-containing protein [Mycolicibacterium pallens]
MRPVRIVAAAVLAAGMLVGGPGTTAGTCACGGIVSPDLDARVTGEQSLVALDGNAETIVMRLDLHSVADNAALIVPTPTPATASQAEPGLFRELERLTAPRIEHGGTGHSGLEEAGAVPGGGPTVVAQVQLGPLEATTLTGGDLTGVRHWLDSNGYTMRPEVTAALDPYLKQGWSFVAMRLTGGAPLSGQLDPVRLDFTSDRQVYPMRMSAVAKDTQRVTIYTLGQHRMQRTDADASRQDVTVDYAGSIEGRTTDQSLTELSTRNPYLPRFRQPSPNHPRSQPISSSPAPPTTTRISASSAAMTATPTWVPSSWRWAHRRSWSCWRRPWERSGSSAIGAQPASSRWVPSDGEATAARNRPNRSIADWTV